VNEDPNKTAHRQLDLRATPHMLSRQLGVPIHEVLAAIEDAHLEPVQNEDGLLEYGVHEVMASVVENQRLNALSENSQIQRLLKECLNSSQNSIRQMLRDENRTAYQIKEMTESRFLEVLGQVSVSMGRVEAFVLQATRLLNQIDLRLSRAEQQVGALRGAVFESPESAPIAEQSEEALPIQNNGLKDALPKQFERPAAELTHNEHWLFFETFLTRSLIASGMMSDSSIKRWFDSCRTLLGFGSLELRLNGEKSLEEIRPALLQGFSALVGSLPSDVEVLPAFEAYFSWVQRNLQKGYPAILLFLVILLNRGAQISWSGFLSTFVNEV
jgi:hypothetical protein